MSTTRDSNTEPFALSPEDANELARELPVAISVLSTIKAAPSHSKYTIAGDGIKIEIPPAVFSFLFSVLGQMAQGNSVFISSVESELSTQRGADLLNVSRPYFINLLQQYGIPYRTVGRYRRVKYKDVMSLKKRLEQEEDQAMAEMVDQSQQLGMPY